jgi:hypothetical protein
MPKRTQPKPAIPRVGWRPNEWADSFGCCTATVWNLIAAKELDTVKIGGMRIITTSPAEYIADKAAQQHKAG